MMAFNLQAFNRSAVKAFQSPDITPKWSKPFPVIGKGTLFFTIRRSSPFSLIVRPQAKEKIIESWIGLNVGKKSVSLLSKKKNHDPITMKTVTATELFGDNVGVEPGLMCTYWLSYDSDRMVVKYGKGYCMEKTTILTQTFEQDKGSEDVWFDPTVHRKVELYEEMFVMASMQTSIVEIEPEVDFDPNPLVSDRHPIVKDCLKANLFDLDDNKCTYSGSLPPACIALYANVIGVDVHLDFVHPDAEDYDFSLSDAIRYSIATPRCALYQKLKDKIGEFGKENLTYLRVTLGSEFGNSPGVPYVLELWPSKHGSPIHNHGNSYAIIRVLHGGLTVHYYNKMSRGTTDGSKCKAEDTNLGLKQLGKLDVRKGDVTWISPRWYQTHRLQNDTDDFCATIQCYAYGTNDNMHWPYFDYLKSCNTIDEFKPDSDFGFKEMYRIVMQEYNEHIVQGKEKKGKERKCKKSKK